MDTNSRDRLRTIARQAMLARGLLPDFSAQASRELDLIPGPATPAASPVRDLRGLLWASIDNDDSRDLDQLSVAETLADGAVRIWVAIAVSTRWSIGPPPSTGTPELTQRPSTPPRKYFRCSPRNSPPI